MRYCSSPAFYQLLIVVAALALYWLYGQTHFYRDPGSIFFDPSRAYERRYSLLREAEATELLVNASNGDQETLRDLSVPISEDGSPRKVDVCIGMGTAKRDIDRQYVDVALASILEGISPQERASIHISLLFANVKHTEHPTWNQPWLRSFVEDAWTYKDYNDRVDDSMMSWITDVSNKHDLHSKSIMDYALVLQRCLDKTDAPYIAAFEDDTLIARGWVAPTIFAMNKVDDFVRRNSRFVRTSSDTVDWLDVRLFNQERSTGWASRRIGDNHEYHIILSLDILFLALFFLFRRRRSAVLQRYTDNWTMALVCLLVLPAIVILFFQSGKASLLRPWPGLTIENFGCCSQALVFNRRQVPALIEHLRASLEAQSRGLEDVQYDMRTRDFARNAGLERLALYPMQVQHIGTHSVAGSAAAEAQAVWSIAFEDLDPARLARKHDKAVEKLYGSRGDD